MHTLIKTLFVAFFAAVFITSCGGDPTASNPDIAKLSESSKNALDKASQALCTCLKQNGEGLKEFINEVKPILADAKKAENPMEAMGKLMGSMAKMKDFGECMDKADPSESEEEKGSLNKDIDAIMGDKKDDFEAKQKKQMEILSAFLNKNCSGEAKLFDDFIQFGEDMRNLSKK